MAPCNKLPFLLNTLNFAKNFLAIFYWNNFSIIKNVIELLLKSLIAKVLIEIKRQMVWKSFFKQKCDVNLSLNHTVNICLRTLEFSENH